MTPCYEIYIVKSKDECDSIYYFMERVEFNESWVYLFTKVVLVWSGA